MVLVTISFSARDETTDFVDFVLLKTSVACNKAEKRQWFQITEMRF